MDMIVIVGPSPFIKGVWVFEVFRKRMVGGGGGLIFLPKKEAVCKIGGCFIKCAYHLFSDHLTLSSANPFLPFFEQWSSG